MNARGLILEGVTGAGKTRTLAALEASGALDAFTIVREDETLGEFMDEELRDVVIEDRAKLRRLDEVMARIRGSDSPFVLERFHPTYDALLPKWELYEEIDAELATRDFVVVLLTVPETMLRARSLDRVDRVGGSWRDDMLTHYGDERRALEALRTSQARRLAFASRTKLRVITIDTADGAWEAYAGRIAEAVRA